MHQLGTVGCNYLEQLLGIYQTSSVVCLNVLNSLNLVVNLTGGLTARNNKKVSYRQYLLTRADSCQLVLGALFAHLDNVFVVSQGVKLLNALTSDESLLAKLITHMTTGPLPPSLLLSHNPSTSTLLPQCTNFCYISRWLHLLCCVVLCSVVLCCVVAGGYQLPDGDAVPHGLQPVLRGRARRPASALRGPWSGGAPSGHHPRTGNQPYHHC